MFRRPPRSTHCISSAASDVYKRQVLTLGPEAAADQLREAMALGIDRAVLLETDGREWDPVATAAAIGQAIDADRAAGHSYDLLLFGNESADSAGYQVGVRVAEALDLPCVTGIKALEVVDGAAKVRRQTESGWETAEITLPAVLTVKEGINLPRYPSLPGRLKAKKKEIERRQPEWRDGGLEKIRLKLPVLSEHTVEILGRNGDVGTELVALFQRLRLL